MYPTYYQVPCLCRAHGHASAGSFTLFIPAVSSLILAAVLEVQHSHEI
jgi:hypothetical protein